MIIYNYDPNTYEYIGESEASLDPEESKIQGKDVYLIPAYATDKKPPKAKVNEIVIYDNGWQIEDDFRGQYIVNNDMKPEVVKEIGPIPEGYVVITDAQAAKIQEDDLYYIVEDGSLIINPNYDEEKQAREDEEFNKAFFNTSLGYVRRTVTMKDGSTCKFLTDILPQLEPGVPVLTYTRQLEQSRVQSTEQFIQECKQQLFIDFYGGV